jgi:cell division protein FtsZ
LAKAVKSVVDVISKPGDINTDFMDVKKVLTNAGKAMMSSSYGEGENRAGDAIEEALKSPLLNSQEIKGAKRILVTVSTCSKRPLLMKEQNTIINYLNERIYAQADMVKFGYSTDNDLNESLYLTVIAAGFEHEEDGFNDYFKGNKSKPYAQGEFETQELIPGNPITLESENLTEEERFNQMVAQYANGGISEMEFNVPTFKRNHSELISLETIRQEDWVVTDLFEN